MIKIVYSFDLNYVDVLLEESKKFSKNLRQYYSQLGLSWKKQRTRKP